MTSYSQNGEDRIIEEYFRSLDLVDPVLLDLGANDGITLSNSRMLLETGKWRGILVEPSKAAFRRLEQNSIGLPVRLFDVAIGIKDGVIDFMESGVHFPNGTDVALVSTINEADYHKWKNTTDWKKYKVNVVTVSTLFEKIGSNKFDFVSIDIEGMDLSTLKQMDLGSMQTKCVCVEHNGKSISEYVAHCTSYGLTEIARNMENIIFVKK